MRFPCGNLFNFIWFQVLWFIGVLGGMDYVWLLALLVGLHLVLVSSWRRELMLITGVVMMGASMDSLLSTLGLFQFESTGLLPIPWWHLLLWCAFAGTLRHSLYFLIRRPALFITGTAVFAPLAYVGAEKLGAVVFPMGSVETAAVVGMVWVALAPFMVALVNLTNKERNETQQAALIVNEEAEVNHA